MEKLKLSELSDDIEVSIEESSTVYTVAELKREIIELGEPHDESSWYTITRKKWIPDARGMVEGYIESEYDNMYEDWDERAWDCVMNHGAIDKIQAILNETFKGEYATAYWTYEMPVEIDILPKTVTS
ncbi:hypothetical protein [Halalkalibacterium ligniniphilum]|uniref:hypothetical protein n=1 Tax=Halalkalibacterium ligniniphilum TaxID=1134413 RepID=UPI00034C2D42|nr:hypothetical protein [Halalkalibacterium ligniniphilum]